MYIANLYYACFEIQYSLSSLIYNMLMYFRNETCFVKLTMHLYICYEIERHFFIHITTTVVLY